MSLYTREKVMRKISIFNLIKTIPLIFSLILVLTIMAMALDYPTKPIQMIVPFPPGGTCDIIARILDPKMASLLGQSVIVVNKPGGGGAIGIKFASIAKPDGYTILTSPTPIVTIPCINPEIGFKLEDFTPIGLAGAAPSAITVKADAPWKTLEELIKEAKKNPGKFTYSTSGPGTGFHFAGELFKLEAGTDIVHVPMGGEAPAVTGLLGGHVDMTFVTIAAVSPHLKAGSLRALALMYHRRIKDFPDISTTKELGYPKLMSTSWYGSFFPAKTPKEIVEKVAKAFETAMKDKEVINKIEKADLLPECLILEEANKFFQDEKKKWSEVAKKAKIEAGK